MATSVTDKQYKALVAELKKNPGNSERHYAEKTGIQQSQIGSVLYKAEVEADPSLKIGKTAAAVAKARNNGLRWPRIAAYSGLSVAKVKELYEEHTGEDASKSWTGRGRRFDGEGKPKKTGTSGRRGSTSQKGQGTSGRRGRGAAAGSKPAPRGARGRRGTRAGADPK
jgi:hypothetical protein